MNKQTNFNDNIFIMAYMSPMSAIDRYRFLFVPQIVSTQ